MNVYKLKGKARCVNCGLSADLYIDKLDVTICKKCGVTLYKNLGTHFVPSAVPNMILRREKQYRPLTHFDENDKDVDEQEILLVHDTNTNINLKKKRKKYKFKKQFSKNIFHRFIRSIQRFFKKNKTQNKRRDK